MIGQTLGHYRIEAKLGEGGMGVVYKASDTHLDRFVALKLLPPERVADAERRLRFVQEAKAASALNHPNILHIYDIDRVEGVDFMAMEFVPGKTLDQMIGRKGLSFNETLRYALQIADALAKAHAAGIVHRDIKPANIMVTGEGLVKVLDFGLAKLTEPVGSGMLGPTETLRPKTEEGTIVGTVAYMSPEQAEGKKVDARSDIFSFGLVLYEMVTGRRAFQGETKLSILSAILHKEPPAVSELAGDVPRDLEKIITRCLRKDPERRIQHMVDVKLALDDLKEESDSGKLFAAAPQRRRRAVPWAVSALVVVVLAAALVALWLMRRPKTLGAPVLMQLTTDTGLTTDPALSPDGKLLAYASDRSGEGNLDIWVRQIGGGEPIRLTQDPADEREPTFSPDGTIIAFRSEKEGGGISVVSALGGSPPRKIAPEGRRPRFSADGSQIAYWSGTIGGGAAFSARNYCRIFVVASAGGAPRQVRPDFVGAAYPEWAPDGKHLLFLGNRDEKLPVDENIDWWVTPLDEGPAIATGAFRATQKEELTGPLLVYPWALIAPVWETRGGSLIFSARSGDSRNLWRIGISTKTWTVTGVPERLTSSSAIEENPSVALAADGTVKIAFTSSSENTDIWSLPLDADTGKVTGELRQLTRDSAADFHPSLSADGRKMVFVSARSGNQEIWIKDLGTGEDAALTASRGDKYRPRFSPDATKVSFGTGTHRDNKGGIYLMPATGGLAEMICEDCGQATGWSPDGRYLIGNSVYGRLFLVEVASRRRIDFLALSGRWFSGGTFSPDGRWITFQELSPPRRECIAPFQGETPAPESAWISVLSELNYWSPDGTLVYGVSDHGGFNCIWAQRVDRATKRPVGSPLPIFHSHGARLTLGLWISLGREKMVFDMAERTGNIWTAQFKDRW
ncbi:MAG: protein kinase [Candidatus Aminicenantes bacterium]|nr:protein kinase [Candidatus Aminicenantes bacterium]